MSNVLRGKLFISALLVLACGGGDDDDGAGPDAAAGGDGGVTIDGGGGDPDAGPAACPRAPAAADRARKVVISHPYDADSNQAKTWAVWDLTAAGELSGPSAQFEMGRAGSGVVHFTPDGEVGIVAQEDGTLGVFGWDASSGAPVVIHAAYAGDFWAHDVVISADGTTVYVLDDQWRVNGGGIYRLTIGCDGSLSGEQQLVAAKLPAALLFVPGDPATALLAARDVLDSPMDLDAHRLDWSATPSWVAGVDAFPDDDSIVGSAAVTHDGKYLLIGDNAGFSGVPNRVAVIEVTAEGLAPRQVLSPISDPYAIVTSPFGEAAIVVSGVDGDAILRMDYDPSDSATPFKNLAELTYVGGRPQLPGKAVLVDRGGLRGRVLVTEVGGIRQVEFGSDGAVTDIGLSSTGDGVESIVGAIGVQP